MIAYKVVYVQENLMSSAMVWGENVELQYELGAQTLGIIGPMFFYDTLEKAVADTADPTGVRCAILECEISRIVQTPEKIPVFYNSCLFADFWTHGPDRIAHFYLNPVLPGVVLAWECVPTRMVTREEIFAVIPDEVQEEK